MSDVHDAHDPPSWPWAVPTLLFLVVTLFLLVGVFTITRKFAPSRTRARDDIRSIQVAQDDYRIEHGKWPATLQALVVPDEHGRRCYEDHDGQLPRDPWGREYRYDPPSADGSPPRVCSLGADDKPGGSGDDADIDSTVSDK